MTAVNEGRRPLVEKRWFFWRADSLSYRWRTMMLGSTEFAQNTVRLRVPGGMLFFAYGRLSEFSGPCARCGIWEDNEAWEPPHCRTCGYELADYAEGCICPSFLDGDDEWPKPGCPVHSRADAGIERQR